MALMARQKAEYRTIKIQDSTYKKLQELVGSVSNAGWAAVGSKRTEAPTQALVVDEAINAMALRVQKKRRS